MASQQRDDTNRQITRAELDSIEAALMQVAADLARVRHDAGLYQDAADNADCTRIPKCKAELARRLYRERREREQLLPPQIFAEPAWDMLLDLYASHHLGRSVAVSSLCIAAAVPATTALRWIKTMVDAGLFVREADSKDGRRIHILLSEATRHSLDAYFDRLS